MSDQLKKGWRVWRFDQMATMVNDRIDDPAEANVEYYVGLEHLDPESLTIRRWGSPSDVNATKLLFRKGDIIFGRRRVYQRKLAVAHFDGICSAHALVLRAKPEVVVPEFLPFFMQSDLFMERAKQISVGSLSPTINWKTLAKEEFALPPMEEQRRMILALQVANNAIEKIILAEIKYSELLRSIYQSFFGSFNLKMNQAEGYLLGNLCDIRRGASPRPIHDQKWFSNDGPGWVRIRDLANNERFLIKTEQKLSEQGLKKSVRVKPGEIILSIAATIGKPAIAGTDLCIHDGFVVINNLSNNIDRDYLYHYLNWFGPALDNLGLLGTQKNVNTKIIEGLRIILPDIDTQRERTIIMNLMFDNRHIYKIRLTTISKLLNHFISGG
jgi:type I restriction enzyme, S subunit